MEGLPSTVGGSDSYDEWTICIQEWPFDPVSHEVYVVATFQVSSLQLSQTQISHGVTPGSLGLANGKHFDEQPISSGQIWCSRIWKEIQNFGHKQ